MTPSTTPLLLPPLFGPKKVISPPQTHILLDFRSCGSKESPDFFVFVRQEKNKKYNVTQKNIFILSHPLRKRISKYLSQ